MGSAYGDNLKGARDVDWKKLTDKLPSATDERSAERRKLLYKQMDANGNGFLSLAETERGVGLILGLDEIAAAKPVMMRAFQVAKKARGSSSKLGADYVERGEEFRQLLLNLRHYFELYAMFNRVDSSDDRRVDFKEFKAAIPELKSWGATGLEDPRKAFDAIDTDGAGMILFDEFASWAINGKLDLLEDDDAAGITATGEPNLALRGVPAGNLAARAAPASKGEPKASMSRPGSARRPRSAQAAPRIMGPPPTWGCSSRFGPSKQAMLMDGGTSLQGSGALPSSRGAAPAPKSLSQASYALSSRACVRSGGSGGGGALASNCSYVLSSASSR